MEKSIDTSCVDQKVLPIDVNTHAKLKPEKMQTHAGQPKCLPVGTYGDMLETKRNRRQLDANEILILQIKAIHYK